MRFPEFRISRDGQGKILLARRAAVDKSSRFIGPLAGYTLIGVFDSEQDAYEEIYRLRRTRAADWSPDAPGDLARLKQTGS